MRGMEIAVPTPFHHGTKLVIIGNNFRVNLFKICPLYKLADIMQQPGQGDFHYGGIRHISSNLLKVVLLFSRMPSEGGEV